MDRVKSIRFLWVIRIFFCVTRLFIHPGFDAMECIFWPSLIRLDYSIGSILRAFFSAQFPFAASNVIEPNPHIFDVDTIIMHTRPLSDGLGTRKKRLLICQWPIAEWSEWTNPFGSFLIAFSVLLKLFVEATSSLLCSPHLMDHSLSIFTITLISIVRRVYLREYFDIIQPSMVLKLDF